MLGARSITRIHWRASGGIVDIASATMLKNSETFLNIFMFSPTLVVEVLYEVLEIIVFIGFKDGFNDKVEVSSYH